MKRNPETEKKEGGFFGFVYELGRCCLVIAVVYCCFLLFTYRHRICRLHPESRCRTQLKALTIALNDYNLDTRQWPTALVDLIKNPGLERWEGPYLDQVTAIPKDPWGNDFVYICPGPEDDDSVLYSLGPDGKSRSNGHDADDISSDCGE